MVNTSRIQIAAFASISLLGAYALPALTSPATDGQSRHVAQGGCDCRSADTVRMSGTEGQRTVSALRQSLHCCAEPESGQGIALPVADARSPEAAPAAPSAETSDSDARLRQTVVVHASGERIADVLAGLSKATGVTLMARMEVADEGVTLWTEGQPLAEVMRDLRHLRGLYWSRSQRDGQWVYSLWQDAQSLAREEAETQRWAIEQQRDFARRIQQRVQALAADDAALKRLAKDDPYLIVQMKHPVVKNGYRLFASLLPDQQAQLTQGQTPSRGLNFGQMLEVGPHRSKPGDPYFNPDSHADQYQPRGDMVTLGWGEMTPLQRNAVTALLKGAVTEMQAEARREKEQRPDEPNLGRYWETNVLAMAAATPDSARVTFFRWGDPASQGLSLHVSVQSGGRDWFVYSNIAASHLPYGRLSNEELMRGERLWRMPAAAERLLAEMRKEGVWRNRPPEPPVFDPKPDPLLDAPLSFTWTLPLRELPGKRVYRLISTEVMAALSQTLRRPLVVDGMPGELHQPRAEGDRFQWKERPARELLERFFQGYRGHIREGTIFLYQPEASRQALHEAPGAVRRFLDAMTGSFTLDDMALLARSLSPWQVVKLGAYLPNVAIDQSLTAQELLKLYGELSPEQRAGLARGLEYALTPPQQALFLRFAQRQRPFMEPWRFQQGRIQLTLGPSPIKDDGRGNDAASVTRALFQARFAEEAAEVFPVDLFPVRGRVQGRVLPSTLVGKPFPGFRPSNRVQTPGDDPIWQPALTDERLQGRPAVIVIARPYVEPYAGTKPPVSPLAWTQSLAGRLQNAGLTIAHVTVGSEAAALPPPGAPRLPRMLVLWEPGDINGEPFDSSGASEEVPQSPTVFVVDRGGIVRAVFEGPAAWDAAAIERAARRLAAPRDTARANPPLRRQN
jgi:hypothetical protein